MDRTPKRVCDAAARRGCSFAAACPEGPCSEADASGVAAKGVRPAP